MVGDSTRGFTTQKRLELYILEAESRASKKEADKAKGKGTGGSGSLKAAVQPAPNGTNVDAGKVARATGLPPEQAVAVSNAAAANAAEKLRRKREAFISKRNKDAQRAYRALDRFAARSRQAATLSKPVRGRTFRGNISYRSGVAKRALQKRAEVSEFIRPSIPQWASKYSFDVPLDVALPFNRGKISDVYQQLSYRKHDGSRTERVAHMDRLRRYGEHLGVPHGLGTGLEARRSRFQPEGYDFQRYLQYNNVTPANFDDAARAYIYNLRQRRWDEAMRVEMDGFLRKKAPTPPAGFKPSPIPEFEIPAWIKEMREAGRLAQAAQAARAAQAAAEVAGSPIATTAATVVASAGADGGRRVPYVGPTEPFHTPTRTPQPPQGPLGLMFNRRTHSYQGYMSSELAANAVTEIKDTDHLTKLIADRAAELRSKNAVSRLSTGEPINTNINLSKDQMDAFGRAMNSALLQDTPAARNAALWKLDKQMGVAERTLDKARRMEAARLDPYGMGTYDGLSVIDPKMRRDMYTMAKSIGSKQDMAFIENFDPQAVDAAALQRRYSRIMSRYKSLDAQNPRSGYGTYLDGSLLTSGKGDVADWIQRARRAGVDASLISRYTDMATEKGVTTDTGRTFYDYTKERPQLKHLIRATEQASRRVDSLTKATDKSRQVFDDVMSGKGLLKRGIQGKFDSSGLVREYAKAMKAQRILGMVSGTEESARVGEFTRAARDIRTATKYNQLAGELERAARRARANIKLEENVDALQREGLLSEQSAAAHRTRLRKKVQAQELRAHRWEVNRDAFMYSLTGRPIDTSQGFFKGVKSAAGQAGSDFGKMFKFNKVNLAMAIFEGVMKALRAWMTLARFGAMFTAVGIGATAMGARALMKTSDEYTNRQNLYNFALPENLRGERSFQQFEDMAYVRGRGLRQSTSTWSSGVMELANAVASATDASGRQLISNMDQVITMYENLSRMQKLAGTSEADFKGVMIQVLQGIGKGKLDMQDIKPILNRSGAFADLLARGVFGLKGRGDLYTKLDEGRGDRNKGLTAERLISGLLSTELTKNLDNLFRKTARTWADVGEIMKSDIGRALLPLIGGASAAGNGGIGDLLTSITGAIADSTLGDDIKNWIETRLMHVIDGQGGLRGAIETCVNAVGALGLGLAAGAKVCISALNGFVTALTYAMQAIDAITPGELVPVTMKDIQRQHGWTDEQALKLADPRYYRSIPDTKRARKPGDVVTDRYSDAGMHMAVVFNPNNKAYTSESEMQGLFDNYGFFSGDRNDFLRAQMKTLQSDARSYVYKELRGRISNAQDIVNQMSTGAVDLFDALAKWKSGDKNPEAAPLASDNVALSAAVQTAANTAAIKHNTAKATEVQIALLKQVAGRAVVNRITNVRPNIVANVGSIKSGADLDEVMKRLEVATASAVAGYAY